MAMSSQRRPGTVPPSLIDTLKQAVGPKGWTDTADEMAPHLVDWRGRYRGRAVLLVRPATTEEVAEVVRTCAAARVPIVPQGGNTGLCGAATPLEDGGEVLLCLSRMNRIRMVDAADHTMTVEAGCVLKDVQTAAEAADRFFPLSLAAEGSCQIGGNISTNAGGINVLRYGNARDLVLGLEVVLPDGRVWDGLRRLRKDNTGYDLKQLFIGAEGTLGIITAAVLKLFPLPRERTTAFVALRDVDAAVELLARCRSASGDAVMSFELVPRAGIDLALKHLPNLVVDPLSAKRENYALIEVFAATRGDSLRASLESVLEMALSDGLVADATIAASGEQARRLWQVREGVVEIQQFAGASVKHDISLPVSRVSAFLARTNPAVAHEMKDVRIVAFGHLGDGNVHYNLYQPESCSAEAFLGRAAVLTRIVHDLVVEFGGSISAEHGIGQLRRGELRRYKSAIEIELMGRLKRALDPHNIMNPGKVIEP